MNTKNLIGGLLAGTAVGIAVGLLLAPESGTKTRERLVEGARKFADNLKGSAKNSTQSLKSSFNSALEEVAANAKDNINMAKDRVKV